MKTGGDRKDYSPKRRPVGGPARATRVAVLDFPE